MMLKRVLYGISCRNYEAAAEAIPGAIGLSASTVSRRFIQASAAKLQELRERDLSGEDVVAVFLDGKTFAGAILVLALGITLSGEKRILGFVETDTENEKVLTPLLRSLVERGIDLSQGMLVIIYVGKGLRAAGPGATLPMAQAGECRGLSAEGRARDLAPAAPGGLRPANVSGGSRRVAAAPRGAGGAESIGRPRSLSEGLEETLTLHRLGVYGVLGCSFKTTNCLESVNALVEERCGKVEAWKNSNQRQRWLATALLDIEPRLHRVRGYRHLLLLREALRRELHINADKDMEVA